MPTMRILRGHPVPPCASPRHERRDGTWGHKEGRIPTKHITRARGRVRVSPQEKRCSFVTPTPRQSAPSDAPSAPRGAQAGHWGPPAPLGGCAGRNLAAAERPPSARFPSPSLHTPARRYSRLTRSSRRSSAGSGLWAASPHARPCGVLQRPGLRYSSGADPQKRNIAPFLNSTEAEVVSSPRTTLVSIFRRCPSSRSSHFPLKLTGESTR